MNMVTYDVYNRKLEILDTVSSTFKVEETKVCSEFLFSSGYFVTLHQLYLEKNMPI